MPELKRTASAVVKSKRGLFLPSTLVAIVVTAVGAGGQPSSWKIYDYPADGFSVALPSAPTIQEQSVPTAAGSFDLRMYLTEEGGAGMMVGVSNFGDLVAGKNADDLLQGGKQGALDNTQTHLVREAKISLDGHPGLEFEAENDKLHAVVRIYLVTTTLYELLVAYPVGKPYEQAGRFFDSFQLKAKTGN